MAPPALIQMIPVDQFRPMHILVPAVQDLPTDSVSTTISIWLLAHAPSLKEETVTRMWMNALVNRVKILQNAQIRYLVPRFPTTLTLARVRLVPPVGGAHITTVTTITTSAPMPHVQSAMFYTQSEISLAEIVKLM
jgi:hypothetical protein